jgi:nucleoside diphosphate kinase
MVLLLCHETENPIKIWKKLIGHMDPNEAKVSFIFNTPNLYYSSY